MDKVNNIEELRGLFHDECAKRGITVVRDHRYNTGKYGTAKAVIYDELLGGIFVQPLQMGIRLSNLMTACSGVTQQVPAVYYIKSWKGMGNEGGKVAVLPELVSLQLTNDWPSQIATWAQGQPCAVVVKEDTPRGLIDIIASQGPNLSIIQPSDDVDMVLRNATEILCCAADKVATKAIWFGKPTSFMKEGRPSDVGAFRALNLLLATNVNTMSSSLNNLLSSKSGGFFIPSRDGIDDLRDFLNYYEDKHETFVSELGS